MLKKTQILVIYLHPLELNPKVDSQLPLQQRHLVENGNLEHHLPPSIIKDIVDRDPIFYQPTKKLINDPITYSSMDTS